MKTKFIRALIVLFFSLTWAGAAQGQASFYQGKTIRLVVGYLSGDTHDLWARAYARHMGKHIPGNPNFVVQNMPGPAPWSRPITCTTLPSPMVSPWALSLRVFISRSLPARRKSSSIGRSTAWIGTPEHNGTLLFMRSDAPFKIDRRYSQSQRRPKCSATGVGTSGHLIPRLLEETLNLKFQIVTGYPGGAEQDLALERGEVQCRAITVAAHFSAASLS